jgi:pSer/pThr/pTyr-binding forkhead associated (FHA) protein
MRVATRKGNDKRKLSLAADEFFREFERADQNRLTPIFYPVVKQRHPDGLEFEDHSALEVLLGYLYDQISPKPSSTRNNDARASIASNSKSAGSNTSAAAPIPKGNVVFKITCPGNKDFPYRLNIGDKVRIGRSEDNDLVIANERTVSRYHCIANVLDDESVRILDQDSTNVPMINGVKSRDGILKMYQTIQLGHARILLTRGNFAFKIKSPWSGHSIYPLYVRDNVKIWQALDNDIVIPFELEVSPYHCVATVLEESVRIEGIDAASIVSINGVEGKEGIVHIYEKLQLGNTELVLVPNL